MGNFVVDNGVDGDCYRIFCQNFLWRNVETNRSHIDLDISISAGQNAEEARTNGSFAVVKFPQAKYNCSFIFLYDFYTGTQAARKENTGTEVGCTNKAGSA